MDRNPYSPPTAPLADATDSGAAFYSPRQIYVASFLGSPVAAAWFIHQNFMALGNRSRALRTLWLGFAATVAAFVVAFYLPDRYPHVLFPLLYSYAIYRYALFLFMARTTSTSRRAAAGGHGGWSSDSARLPF